jgi:nucleotide-binding universal stress UspA family protein
VLQEFGAENIPEAGEIDLEFYERYWETIKQYYIKILSNAEEIVKREWPSIKYHALLVEGRPSNEILSVANRCDVNLILLGSRGIGGMTGLLGSTSKSVVESCKRPVFIIK